MGCRIQFRRHGHSFGRCSDRQDGPDLDEWGFGDNGSYRWAGMAVFSDVELVRMIRRFLQTKPVDDGKAALLSNREGNSP